MVVVAVAVEAKTGQMRRQGNETVTSSLVKCMQIAVALLLNAVPKFGSMMRFIRGSMWTVVERMLKRLIRYQVVCSLAERVKRQQFSTAHMCREAISGSPDLCAKTLALVACAPPLLLVRPLCCWQPPKAPSGTSAEPDLPAVWRMIGRWPI